MDKVQQKLKILRTKLDKFPVLQKAEVRIVVRAAAAAADGDGHCCHRGVWLRYCSMQHCVCVAASRVVLRHHLLLVMHR
jgi:hypothetical protein